MKDKQNPFMGPRRELPKKEIKLVLSSAICFIIGNLNDICFGKIIDGH